MPADPDILGTLVVVVLKARNLSDKHSFYKQDAYASITLAGNTQQTPVDVKGGQHPVWDFELRFDISKDASEKQRTLEVACWAKESRTDDNLGEGKVDIKETLRTGEFDDWVTLEVGGQYKGELYLEMTFFSATGSPPPSQSTLSHSQPSQSLAVPSSSALNKRPSKLKPSERLARPTVPNSPLRPAQNLAPPFGSPPSSRPSSTSPKLGAALPPLPSTLLPGGGAPHHQPPSSPPTRPQPSSPQRTQRLPLLPQNVPATLRPGSSPPRSADHSRHSSPDYEFTTPSTIYQESTSPYATQPSLRNPYIDDEPSQLSFPVPALPAEPAQAPYRPTHQPTQQPSYNASFPQPQSPPPPQHSYAAYPPQPQPLHPQLSQPYPLHPHPPQQHVPQTYPSQSYSSQSYTSWKPTMQAAPALPPRKEEDLPDPYLLARYHSPLPLPPDSPTQPLQNNYQKAQQQQQQQQQQFPPPPLHPVQAVPPASTAPASRQQHQTTSSFNDQRRAALLREEEALARKREQELRDEELARELDRELNAQESAPGSGQRSGRTEGIPGFGRAGMPGGF